MPVNLSIRNVPDDVLRRLEERAARHRRSLQGELLAIIVAAARPRGHLTPADLLAKVRRLGLATDAESVAIVRQDRAGR